MAWKDRAQVLCLTIWGNGLNATELQVSRNGTRLSLHKVPWHAYNAILSPPWDSTHLLQHKLLDTFLKIPFQAVGLALWVPSWDPKPIRILADTTHLARQAGWTPITISHQRTWRTRTPAASDTGVAHWAVQVCSQSSCWGTPARKVRVTPPKSILQPKRPWPLLTKVKTRKTLNSKQDLKFWGNQSQDPSKTQTDVATP